MVFTDKTETNQSDQAEQAKDQAQTQESFLDKLVQAKGDNWRNPEVLAKGKLEADGYIKTLEEQLAQMREELDKKEYMSKVMSQAEGKAPELTAGNSQSARDNGSTNQENTTPKISEDDLKNHLKVLEERKERDHRKLGKELKIFELKIKKKELLNKKADGGSAIKNISKEIERIKTQISEKQSKLDLLFLKLKKILVI